MKKNSKTQELDNLIGQKLAESFGYSDEQLVAEFDRVAAESKELEEPELDGQTDTFEKILLRMDHEKQKKPKVVPMRRRMKIGILAAALAMVCMSTAVVAGGRGEFEYWIRDSREEENRTIWNNSENMLTKDIEEAAYDKIGKELDINVAQLMYKPEGMRFDQVDIQLEYATMQFSYDNKKLYLIQTKQNSETSIGISMDQSGGKQVFNRYLKRDITIKKNITENNEAEFLAEFTYEGAAYRIEGIIDEEEFEKIVKKIILEK